MVLSLVLPLVLIPKIESRAYYPYLGDFTHTYNGQSYFFDFVNESDIPQDIQIDSSIFDSVIQAELSMDSMRIAQQGYIISSISDYAADLSSLLVNFALSSIDIIYQGLVDSSRSMLKWSVNFNGSVGTNRYSWTFSCPLGSQDIILGSDGLLPHPGDHTYTSHDDQVIANIIDDQVIDNNIYIPSGKPLSFTNLKSPYIKGKDLIFYVYNGQTEHVFKYSNFTDCLCALYPFGGGGNSVSPGFISIIDSHSGASMSNSDRLTVDGAAHSFSKLGGTCRFTYKNRDYTNCYRVSYISGYNDLSVNLPMYKWTSAGLFNLGIVSGTVSHILNNTVSNQNCELIFLQSKLVSPVSNPDDIIIPINQPIPADTIIPWPEDNLPDDSPDGYPTVVEPFDPEPINPVVPLPPIPSVVSSNDDLWPDLNDLFDTNDNIISFAFPAVNVEFPDLSVLLGNFVTSFTWVSTIITALFNGSDFSVLFSVLAFFFIAAAMLGIYKWWK